MASKSQTRSSVDRGPVMIDGVTVVLRPPRLADGPSWRKTALAFTERLSPAFTRDDMDWESAHSPVIWVDTWRSALADARAGGVSYLLVRIDEGAERVVGHFSMTGIDPRTGGAEISTWAVDVPPAVSRWAQLTTVLSAFEGNPAVPHALAPTAVSNMRANRFSQSMGWNQLQIRRALRPYDGQVSDHHVWILANTAEYRDWVKHQLSEIPITRARFTPAGDRWPDVEYLAAWARFAAIRARQLIGTALRRTPLEPAFEIPSAGGEVVQVAYTGHGRYRVTVAERPGGSIDVHSDVGTSTTELVPRFESRISDDARVSALSALASHLTARSDRSRRTVIAVRAVDSTLADRLATLGFIDEGDAPPTQGGDGATLRMWTLLASPHPK
ncbi:GNAT family N-acetyltransferase [Mycobacterium sp. D16R24]|uniref:GNAT family N-acetyltransferase n=1 Tax=Mycobacterium sp. D16R24 TaxID=1855656 RepID=UPI001115C839|nr:GNAT family N-acetyltransferase [Mycobacterium sp. D16R24]